MHEPTLRIIKLTPIALAVCEVCKMEFHSLQRVEDNAERELRRLFESHECQKMGEFGTRARGAGEG